MFETEASHEPEPDIDPASLDVEYESRRSPRYERGGVEYGRIIGFFDATFAVASTLLVTTLNPGRGGWANWSVFARTESGPLFAFALSFTVIVWFWWTNHRFVSTLDSISPHYVAVTLLMLAFVVLIPFSSEGLGTYRGDAGQVATVVYAVNVALASLLGLVGFLVAVHDGLFRRPLPREVVRTRVVVMIDTPIVFLLSVPIALLWSSDAAHYCWIALIPTGVLARRWARGRAEARRAAHPETAAEATQA